MSLAEVEPVKNRLIKKARQKGMESGEAQSWAYVEIDRLCHRSSDQTQLQPRSVPEDPGVIGLDGVAAVASERIIAGRVCLGNRQSPPSSQWNRRQPIAQLLSIVLVGDVDPLSSQVRRHFPEGSWRPG